MLFLLFFFPVKLLLVYAPFCSAAAAAALFFGEVGGWVGVKLCKRALQVGETSLLACKLKKFISLINTPVTPAEEEQPLLPHFPLLSVEICVVIETNKPGLLRHYVMIIIIIIITRELRLVSTFHRRE